MDRQTNGYKSAIWQVATGGGRPRQFTSGDKRDSSLHWSPDGKQIAFTTRLNAEEMAAEEEAEPERPLDPDEIGRRAEEKKRVEKARTDPRVIDRFAYRAETSVFDDRTKHIYVEEG